MGLTNFPGGVSSMGVPLVGSGQTYYGRYWFVDAKTGSDGNSGRSKDRPFQTMSKAFSMLDSGDVVVFRGKVREQLTTPAGVFDVTIIGAGNRPRHADDHTETGGARGSSAATWMAPASPTAATPNLKVIMQGWRFQNFLMASSTTSSAGIQLVANELSGASEYNGGHAHFYGMRFDACPIGIQTMAVGFVGVENCYFRGNTTAAIGTTAGGGGTIGFWEVKGNRFMDNASHIIAAFNQCDILGNVFGKFTTSSINLTNGGGYNQVHGNYLSGSYITDSNQYVAAANDDWSGNFSMDEDEATVTSGITHAVPTTD